MQVSPSLPVLGARPPIFTIPYDCLLSNRHSISKESPAFRKLIFDANKLLEKVPVSVLNKTSSSPSTDIHDYFSLAPYFWPNPDTADGLPYIRKDGRINPTSKDGTDQNNFYRTCESIYTLGLAYWYTLSQPYADKAVLLARVWFLDPATRMNPHLRYAQGIPGLHDGSGFGVLEGRYLTFVLDGLAFLGDSFTAYPEEDRIGMMLWLEDYYVWLTTSEAGVAAKRAENNHGSWYDVQSSHIALILGKLADAVETLTEARHVRLDRQILPSGEQPLELARTNSLEYCIMNMQALTRLAIIGDSVGVSLWSYHGIAESKRSLWRAVHFLSEYVDPERVWTYKEDHKPADREKLIPILYDVLRHESEVMAVIQELGTGEEGEGVARPDASAVMDKYRQLINTHRSSTVEVSRLRFHLWVPQSL